jgi:hypothetical protein
MARKQTTASQRQLLERALSQLATWIQDLAPQAQVDITLSNTKTKTPTSTSNRLRE